MTDTQRIQRELDKVHQDYARVSLELGNEQKLRAKAERERDQANLEAEESGRRAGELEETVTHLKAEIERLRREAIDEMKKATRELERVTPPEIDPFVLGAVAHQLGWASPVVVAEVREILSQERGVTAGWHDNRDRIDRALALLPANGGTR